MSETAGTSPLFRPFVYTNEFNPDDAKMASAHMQDCHKYGFPELRVQSLRNGKMVIAGAAPSIVDHLEEIRALADDPENEVFAIGDAHGLLIDNGIVPDGSVMFEIAIDPHAILKRPHWDTTYYVSSMCHPSTFEALAGHRIVLWHPVSNQEDHHRIRSEMYGDTFTVGGGAATLTRTLPIGLILGFRDFELFGVDCSHRKEADSHFFGTPDGVGDEIEILVELGTGKRGKFSTRPYLARQANEIKEICQHFHHMFKMKTHGDGLLPFIHQNMFPQFYAHSTQ